WSGREGTTQRGGGGVVGGEEGLDRQLGQGDVDGGAEGGHGGEEGQVAEVGLQAQRHHQPAGAVAVGDGRLGRRHAGERGQLVVERGQRRVAGGGELPSEAGQEVAAPRVEVGDAGGEAGRRQREAQDVDRRGQQLGRHPGQE